MAEDKLRRQEYYRKFYTDLNDMRIEMGLPPKKYHLDLLEDEVFSRTIFVKIHNQTYSISYEELNQIFSRFGILDDVVIFSHGHGFHSKICFSSKESMIRAFELLNSRNIYDNCCKLELFLVQDFIDEPVKADFGQIVKEHQNCVVSLQESTEQQIKQELQILESPPQKQQEESSRHIEELQGSIVQKSKKLEIDVSGSSPQSKRIPVPLNQAIFLTLETQLNEFEDNSTTVTPTENQNSPPRLVSEQVVHRSSSTKTNEVRFKLESERVRVRWSLEVDVRKQDHKSLSSLEPMAAKQTEGNGIHSGLELAEWDFLVLDDSLGVKDLELPVESLDFGGAHKVLDIMPTTNIVLLGSCFHLMKSNAQVMFEKMSEMEVGVGDESIKLLRTFRTVFGSIESIGSFVFDPGKSNVYRECLWVRLMHFLVAKFLGFVSGVARGS